MPVAPKRPHRAALTRMLRSTGLAHVPEEAPLVELLRTLADEMDAGGGSRVQTQYRGALKDARVVLNLAPGRPKVRVDSAPVPEPVVSEANTPAKVNDLAAFKLSRGIIK